MSKEPELTRNQALVFETLNAAGGPMSAYTILDKLRTKGFRAPLQVYRALEKLLDFGMVHRLESLNAFVACSSQDCHTGGWTAFAICEKCGTVSEFADKAIARRLANWAGEHNFSVDSTTVEIRGLCSDCSS